jgi:hypothetical protein
MSSMHTQKRIDIYTRQNKGARLTHRQRRRAVKKAGPEAGTIIYREDGYSAAMQGYREIVEIGRPKAVREPGRGTGRGHHVIDVILDEGPF